MRKRLRSPGRDLIEHGPATVAGVIDFAKSRTRISRSLRSRCSVRAGASALRNSGAPPALVIAEGPTTELCVRNGSDRARSCFAEWCLRE